MHHDEASVLDSGEIVETVERCLSRKCKAYIVLDGFDECGHMQQDLLCLRKRCIHLSSCHVQITTFLLAYFGLLGQGPSNFIPQFHTTAQNLPVYY
jgi:hypothetical protein